MNFIIIKYATFEKIITIYYQVKLICTAAVAPHLLFITENDPSTSNIVHEETFMFSRAVSRLHEMTSVQYLESAHRSS